MRTLILLAAFSFGFAAYAQQASDANPPADQNRQGAAKPDVGKSDADAMDPATKARVRVEGVPGGTGAHVPKEASGGVTVGNGAQHRRSPPKPPDPQQGENRDEKNDAKR